MKKVLLPLFIIIILGALLLLSCESSYVKGAKLYMAQGNYEKAREQFEKGIQATPNSPLPYYWLGVIDSYENKWEDMITNFDKSLSIGDKFAKDIETHKQGKFKDFMSKGITKYNNGAKMFTEPDINMDNVKAIFSEVIELMETALIIDPDNEQPAELLSRSFMLLGEDEKAIAFYEQLLAKDQKHTVALSWLGNMYFKEAIKDDNKELLNKSVNYNERLLEEKPNEPRAMKDLALSYYNMGNTEKAMEIFEDAVAHNESDLILRVNYGKILYETGEKEKAEEVLKIGLEMDPDNIVALKTLARFYTIDIKDYEKGRNILAKLVEVEPENGNMWEMLGICEANLGNKEEAENAFKKAEDLRTVSP